MPETYNSDDAQTEADADAALVSVEKEDTDTVRVTATTDETPNFVPALDQSDDKEAPSALHERILTLAETELDIDTRVIELPVMFSVKTDGHGDKYVTDINGTVRYYLRDQALYPTEDYLDNEVIADGTQRKTDLAQMY